MKDIYFRIRPKLTFQWIVFKLSTPKLQNVVFVLKTMTENFICIQIAYWFAVFQ